MTYGYLRVSTAEQNEARQLAEMEKLAIDRYFMDHASGKDFNRPAYKRLVRRLKRGDLVVVKSIDRLGRNYDEIQREWQRIVQDIGADIQVLDMPLLNTSAPELDLTRRFIADLVLQVLSFVAEHERDSIRQRQAEGIAQAKKRGVHLGRPMAEADALFEENYALWLAGDISAAEAARRCDLPRSTFYYRAQVHKHAALAEENTDYIAEIAENV